jgi:Histidine phosphatase superfamily (branch 2)
LLDTGLISPSSNTIMASRRLLVAAALSAAAMAQNSTINGSVLPTEYVWGTVILNLFADRIPLLSENYSVITPTGQNQMYETGQFFRDRYISPSNVSSAGNFTIQGISPDMLDLGQVNITTMGEVWIQQSAQAFMEGLYPPLNDTVTEQTGGPLNSFQNPLYYVASNLDPNYLYLNGSANCPAFDTSVSNWISTPEFQNEIDTYQQFMNSLRHDLDPALNVFPNTPSWFGSSYLIWDWIQHQAMNNSAMAADAQGVRYVADAYMQGIYGNVSADNGIRAIGGYTLAADILGGLYAMVDYNSSYWPMNIYFTGPEPWISLGALMQLTSQAGSPWQGLPDPGSSLVFELFSSAATSQDNLAGINPEFPTLDNLQVRVLFRNGTNSTSNLNMQGMFGQPTGNGDPQAMLFNDFSNNMSSIAAGDPATWCSACNAQNAIWCAYYTDGAVGLGSPSSSHSSDPITPTIAGVIGALVALAVAGGTVLVAMLCFGLRFRRKERKSANPTGTTTRSPKFAISSPLSSPRSPKAGLGGFKGGEKLASDVDLPSGAAPIGASIVKSSGHERTESWELRENQRKSLDDELRAAPRESV